MSTAVFRRVLEWQLGAYRVEGDMPRLLVATPPGETHELGALMVAVCAVCEEWGITYLGPDLPVAELLAAARDIEARAVALSTVYSPDDEDLLAAVKATREGLPRDDAVDDRRSRGKPLEKGNGSLRGDRAGLAARRARAMLRELREAE